MTLRIGVVGAGGFGRALAIASARNGQDVTLWSRKERELPWPIRSSTDIESMRDRELIFVAVPARHAVAAAWYEADSSLQHEDTQAALAPLIELADRMVGFKQRIGRSAPDVIT